MKVRLIELRDAPKLLDFESKNRDWFERTIDSRGEYFYCSFGVLSHIEECLYEYQQDVLLPMLIVGDDGQILGRINLSNIDQFNCRAELGYRVGQAFTNQGIAKEAVAQIKQHAQQYGLEKLIAYAATTNPASQKVLMANEFVVIEEHSNFATINGVSLTCLELECSLI